MPSITTTSNPAFIDQQVYSDYLLMNLGENLLPDFFYRNVTDFGSGGTLNIPTIGVITLQDITEDEDPTYNPIESGRVNLTITEEVGDAWYITDNMREDGTNIDMLLAGRADEGSRALKEYVQTTAYQALYDAQTASNANSIDGFAHRSVGSLGSNNALANSDLIDMRLAFNKANVPGSGRIAIVDPVVASTLERSFQGTYNVDSNMTMQSILENGLAEGMEFAMELFGWNIFTSNLLPQVASGTNVDGTNSVGQASVANLFFSIADDNTTPLMGAWRRMPTTETMRNSRKRRDEFTTTSRWGWGAQRVDSLGVIVTSATHTA